MRNRWGFGPVFGFECLTVPRRWQVFAGRSLFVAAMLASLWFLWLPSDHMITNLSDLSAVGNRFFQSLIVIQVTVVLLVSPAATAGSLCVDKGRGTLYHAFVTDLSDREIVLGKLGARVLSLLAFLACGVPVLALGGLLGGVEYGAIAGAFLVSAGVAVVASCLAMAFSVWVRKPHQALLPTYAILIFWIFLVPISKGYTESTGRPWDPSTSTPLRLILLSNPFGMALGPYLPGGDAMVWWEPAAFLLGCLAVSWGLVALAVSRLRPVAIRQMDKPKKREKAGTAGRILDYLPGPPLDGNPVLWREWHRKKPTKWTGRAWTAYVVLSTLASLFVLVAYFLQPGMHAHQLAAQVNGCEVALGLLLLTISATTALAEERDRGSLDVIMTTPLPTRTILWGKWWGTFAMVPRMAILPIWVSGGLALVSGNFLDPLLMIGLILAMSAAITSLGLALATWVPHLGRAIATGVLIYALGSIGLVFVHNTLNRQPTSPQVMTTVYAGGPNGQPVTLVMFTNNSTFSFNTQVEPPNWDWLLLANPYYAAAEPTAWAGRLSFNPNQGSLYRVGDNTGRGYALAWIGAYAAIAAGLMALVLATFDGCLGRITRSTPNWAKRDAHSPKPEPSLAGSTFS